MTVLPSTSTAIHDCSVAATCNVKPESVGEALAPVAGAEEAGVDLDKSPGVEAAMAVPGSVPAGVVVFSVTLGAPPGDDWVGAETCAGAEVTGPELAPFTAGPTARRKKLL